MNGKSLVVYINLLLWLFCEEYFWESLETFFKENSSIINVDKWVENNNKNKNYDLKCL